MVAAQPRQQEPLYMTEPEYLVFEDASESRYEYVDGSVTAMAGAEWEHVMITQSVSAALYRQLRGTPCRVATSDLRLKVESKKVSYRYPDCMVICGEPEFADDRKIIKNPILIVEVLSPSTALEDRNAKLDEYTLLESVQEYVLIPVDEAKVETFSRHESGKWFYASVKGLENTVTLVSIGYELPLAEVYEQMTFDDADR